MKQIILCYYLLKISNKLYSPYNIERWEMGINNMKDGSPKIVQSANRWPMIKLAMVSRKKSEWF